MWQVDVSTFNRDLHGDAPHAEPGESLPYFMTVLKITDLADSKLEVSKVSGEFVALEIIGAKQSIYLQYQDVLDLLAFLSKQTLDGKEVH